MFKIKSLTGLISISATLLCIFLFFVSLLGENHKIDSLVYKFFNDIRTQNYLDACMATSPDTISTSSHQTEACYNRIFLLELALLKHFDLLTTDNNYEIKIKRNKFWFPYLSSNESAVSVVFKKIADGNVMQTLSDIGSDKSYVDNLIIVERSKGSWIIKEISVNDSSIANTYEEISKKINFDKYIEKTKNGFRLKSAEVDLTSISTVEQRLLKFSLLKVSSLMEN